mgnify:FL=1
MLLLQLSLEKAILGVGRRDQREVLAESTVGASAALSSASPNPWRSLIGALFDRWRQLNLPQQLEEVEYADAVCALTPCLQELRKGAVWKSLLIGQLLRTIRRVCACKRVKKIDTSF